MLPNPRVEDGIECHQVLGSAPYYQLNSVTVPLYERNLLFIVF